MPPTLSPLTSQEDDYGIPPCITFRGVQYTHIETFTNGISPVGRFSPPSEADSKPIAVKYFNPSLPNLPLTAQDAYAVWSEFRDPLLRAGFPDYFECNSTHQIVEYIHGIDVKTLSDYRNDLAIPEIRNMVLSIIPQVGAMMDAKIVHGDLKPANIVIRTGSSLTPQCSSTLIDPDTMRRDGFRAQVLVGTPFYMAPELTRGTYLKTSDAFSLAMTAINLLSCKRYDKDIHEKALVAVDTNKPLAIMRARAYDRVFTPNAREFMDHTLVPKAANCRAELHQLLDFIFRCGHPDPSARPQSGEEMTQILTTKPNRIEI